MSRSRQLPVNDCKTDWCVPTLWCLWVTQGGASHIPGFDPSKRHPPSQWIHILPSVLGYHFLSSIFTAWLKLNKLATSTKWQETQEGWMSAPTQICSALPPVLETCLEKWVDINRNVLSNTSTGQARQKKEEVGHKCYDSEHRTRINVSPFKKNRKHQMQGGCLCLQAAHKKQGVNRLSLRFPWIPVLLFSPNMILWHILRIQVLTCQQFHSVWFISIHKKQSYLV